MRYLPVLRTAFERLLEIVVMVLMVAMAVLVIVAVVYRKAGASLVWYDEVASIMLAWLTYYGAALAAFKRAHIGFPGFVNALPMAWKLPLFVFSEAIVIGFFMLLTWTGWTVVQVLDTDTLVSLPEVSTQYTQSVIPIGGALFVIAQLVSIPCAWRDAKRGVLEHAAPVPLVRD